MYKHKLDKYLCYRTEPHYRFVFGSTSDRRSYRSQRFVLSIVWLQANMYSSYTDHSRSTGLFHKLWMSANRDSWNCTLLHLCHHSVWLQVYKHKPCTLHCHSIGCHYSFHCCSIVGSHCYTLEWCCRYTVLLLGYTYMFDKSHRSSIGLRNKAHPRTCSLLWWGNIDDVLWCSHTRLCWASTGCSGRCNIHWYKVLFGKSSHSNPPRKSAGCFQSSVLCWAGTGCSSHSNIRIHRTIVTTGCLGKSRCIALHWSRYSVVPLAFYIGDSILRNTRADIDSVFCRCSRFRWIRTP